MHRNLGVITEGYRYPTCKWQEKRMTCFITLTASVHKYEGRQIPVDEGKHAVNVYLKSRKHQKPKPYARRNHAQEFGCNN